MHFLFPVFALVALTFAVTFSAFIARVRTVATRRMDISEFKLLDIKKAPPFVERSTRHMANLFEMPVLFYVASLVALNLRLDDALALALAWTYVALRYAHSFIHLTYNHVPHRMPVFMTSNLVMAALWMRIFVMLP
ncbi:MAG TPA: MAPEG family protein [Polyangiaceae bacterium]|nr:MAPEG family protein [Polyangiaceae bacterium]